MTDDPRLREILDHAADLPAAERAAYLTQACGEDAAMRTEIESLLRALEEADEFLSHPTLGEHEPKITAPSEPIGGSIGSYRLVEKLGEGGMGVVYLAEQEKPLRRQVALKVIKPGMDTTAVIARFEAEREALALMSHTNIARVYDAGTTASGRPYFVMELVQGVPITRYCDSHLLPLERRLKLFATICLAVQHAHQKGILHRDLKPSNVLIAIEDGQPVVKVIDFGIAKAIDPGLVAQGAFTQLGMLIGTPEYMSPEQAAGGSDETDTRSDVYALGVLLYELLTGTTPLDRGELLTAGYEHMMRVLREVEPPRPSKRFSHAGSSTAASASALRGTEPHRLADLLVGDLDVIVMKCLEKDRGRRYASAKGLCDDILRFLNQERVEAELQSRILRPRRTYQRYRTAWRILGVLVLLLGIAVLIVQLRSRMTRTQQTGDSTGRTSQSDAHDAAKLAQSIDDLEDSAAWNSPRKSAVRWLAANESAFEQVANLRPNESAIWIGRAQYRALVHRWPEAALDYSRVIDTCPVSDTFMEYSALLLLIGDDKGYQQLCERLASRGGMPDGPASAFIMARACTAGPRSGIDPAQPVAWATQAVKDGPNAWRLHALAMAQYRAGAFKAAMASSREAHKYWAPAQHSDPENGFVIAMSYQMLGDHKNAVDWVRGAGEEIPPLQHQQAGDLLDLNVADWLGLQLLQREAQKLIIPEASVTQPATSQAPASQPANQPERQVNHS